MVEQTFDIIADNEEQIQPATAEAPGAQNSVTDISYSDS